MPIFFFKNYPLSRNIKIRYSPLPSISNPNGMFVLRDFRKDGKLRREKWRESIFSEFLVGRGKKIGRS